MIHVAILMPKYVALLLDGGKTVESRLYRTVKPPIGCANLGERVYVKQSSGPFRAVARIAAVKEYHHLNPEKVAELAARYNRLVRGDDEYWHAKRDSRFASFITLEDVQPIDTGPRYTQSMRAWHTLDETRDPVVDLPVTRGGLKNHYLYVPAACGLALNRKRIRLRMPDDQIIDTDLTSHGYFRWRGWGRYYERHAVRPGDRVRLIALGGDQYRVRFLPHA